MRTSPFLIRSGTLALVGGLILGQPGAAMGFGLTGAASDYNLFLFENLYQRGGDVEGRAAVGGNASLTSVGIADRLPSSNGSDTHFVVGGDLTIQNSGIFGGNANVGGTVTGDVYFNNCQGCQVTSDDLIDFEAARNHYQNLSQTLFNLETTGTTSLNPHSKQLRFTGNNTGTNVFNVSLSEAREIFLDAPSSSDLVVINVTDETFAPNWFGSLFHEEANADSSKWQNVIWNFANATTIDFSFSWRGTVLAPNADISLRNGNIEGQVIANSARLDVWSGEFHNYEFTGTLPPSGSTPDDPSTPPLRREIPEPTMILGLLAVGAMGLVKRRNTLEQPQG
ncbi:choice-of-anchor A family protein [Phormidium yuhuli AB48]|uniref:Choice-of-anchor A family protein n=1 Tax=Phormidium yuhuli AB48 TaxID=2940671 RepID=A0ABY5ARU9_9CYAN|nr:collagen-binding domain-containing protein [Phormidium yuhuli]USR91952.1 choice-of-anchor A family protein [Phormidium yuhuli AB48]